MRRPGLARAAATVGVLTVVLTSCGLAATTSPALAPELVLHARAEAVSAPLERPAAPAVFAATTEQVLHKVVLPPEPAVAMKPTLAAASLPSLPHLWQSLNNCGPASVVMLLSTLGIKADQEEARLALRGPDWRRGMGPGPVDGWVNKLYGMRAIWRNNGTNALIKTLITNGFAPMVTQWLEDPTISRISHWRAVAGYDDREGVFYVNDPMRGRGVPLTYQWFDKNWQPFSYRYLVIYKPEDEPVLRAIVNADWSERAMRQRFYERMRAEALERGDSSSWLAYGEAAYQNGMFGEAVTAFEKGLALGSAEGVFTLRSSYPQALRALGRDQDAAKAQQQITSVTSAVAPALDSLALQLAIERLRYDASIFSQ